MQISVNGEAKAVSENSKLHDLLKTMNLLEKRIAVEINQDLVTRSEFDTFELSEGDQVEIVQAIGGG